jgi:hypothetical protein
MNSALEKRGDVKLRSAVDKYLDHIKKSFKDAIYSTGAWDEDAVNAYIHRVKVASRGELLAIQGGKKIHSFVSSSPIGNFEKGSIFSVGWFGKPNLKYSTGNVFEASY